MQHSFGTAIRWLTSAPLVTLLVVLTIGLGVGASTAILGALESVINPFRFEHADRTFVIWRGMRDRDLLLPPVGEQVELWRRATAFEQLEAFTVTEMTLTGRGPAEWLQVAHISPSLPALVGAEPVLGRGFAVESQPGAPPVVILSHALWKTRFGAQPVLGQTVTLDGMSRTIVGVMPPHFKLPSPLSWRYDALVPLVPSAELGNLTVAARLRDGVTPAQAEEELAALGLAAAEAGGGPRWTGRVLEPEFFARNVRETLELLMVAVGLLLLICCVNVSNLLLAQGHSRAREMAVRAALGAKRGRLLLELLLSSVILGLGGAITGVLLAIWGSDLLLAIRPDDLRSLERLSLNPTVLGFAVTLSVGTGVVVGLVPAFRLSSTRSLLLLRGGGGTEPRGAFGRRFRLALVVVQVALSFALLVESGLLVRSVARQVQVPLGFEAQRLAVVDASAPQWKFPDDRTTSALFHEIRDRIAALPGVESASLAVGVPPRAAIFFGDLEIDGRPGRAAQNQAVFFGGSVDADYFTTVGQSIVAGRGFTPEEVRQGASVRIIGEGAARRFFPGGAAIGMRMRLGSRDPWSTIVGIAADVRAGGLGEAGDGLQLYEPLAKVRGSATVVARVTGQPEAILGLLLQTAAAVDPDVPVANASSVMAQFVESAGRQVFTMRLLIAFAALAVGLAAVGLYGVLRHVVGQRTRELGIRMALGATDRDIVKLILGAGALTASVGVALGAPLAYGGTWLLRSQLFGVSRADFLTYTIAAVILGLVTFVAAYTPARRAARVHSADAIRTE